MYEATIILTFNILPTHALVSELYQ